MMEGAKFSIGDKVKLKGGGPTMTINGISAGTRSIADGVKYECMWFIPPAEVRGTDFHEDALEPVSALTGGVS